MRRIFAVSLAAGALVLALGATGATGAPADDAPAGYGPGPGPPSGRWTSNWFQSPTRNIRCRYYPSRGYVACTSRNNGTVAGVTLYGRSYRRYDGYRFNFPGGPVLAYGQNWVVRNRFRCDSRYNGMTCRSLQTGRGFFINRSYSRLF